MEQLTSCFSQRLSKLFIDPHPARHCGICQIISQGDSYSGLCLLCYVFPQFAYRGITFMLSMMDEYHLNYHLFFSLNKSTSLGNYYKRKHIITINGIQISLGKQKVTIKKKISESQCFSILANYCFLLDSEPETFSLFIKNGEISNFQLLEQINPHFPLALHINVSFTYVTIQCRAADPRTFGPSIFCHQVLGPEIALLPTSRWGKRT